MDRRPTKPVSRRSFVVASALAVLSLAHAEPAYAVTRKRYKIVYKLAGGKNPKSQRKWVAKGARIAASKLKDPERKGYVFKGWYTNKAHTKKLKWIRGSSSKSRRTTWARWSPKAYRISYTLNGGSLPAGAPRSYTIEDEVTLMTPSRKGYRFVKWYRDEALSSSCAKIPAGSTGSKQFYARWKPFSYNISYELNGGDLPEESPDSYTIEDTPLALPTPESSENVAFDGWYANEEMTDFVSEVAYDEVGDLRLYASWKPCWSDASEERAAMMAASSSASTLNLLHFSDIHGSKENLERIIAFSDAHPGLLDGMICTGDLVSLRFKDGMDFWDDTPGAEQIFTCVGNHDYLMSEGKDWSQLADMATAAAAYIDPYISNWGGDIESVANATYYAKNFVDVGVKMIVLDCMIDGDDAIAQGLWLDGQLSEALAKGMGVVVAAHYPIWVKPEVACPFTSSYEPDGSKWVFSSCDSHIESFEKAGGEFICYLTGHLHKDKITCNADTSRRIDVNVSCATSKESLTRYDNMLREPGFFSQDLFNLVSINRDDKMVTIWRIGADEDEDARERSTWQFSYANPRVLSGGYPFS